MDIIRYVDQDWHHYCERSFEIEQTIHSNFESYKQSTAGKKFSYIQNFGKTQNNFEDLYLKIKKHLDVSDHVFVGFGEPLITYKDPKHGWDAINNTWDGPFYSTNDFINKFDKQDAVTFFANAVSNVDLNRPLHYLNDMFFESNKIYQNFDICKRLLELLENNYDKPLHWELMCSHNITLYQLLKKHPVNSKTFSTCHALGITHWGPDVRKPIDSKTGGETFDKRHNIRVSDLIDPSIYNQSYYSCVVETFIPPNNSMCLFSEKQAKPIVAKRPFIIVGTKDHLKAFRKLGFKTFSPVIDESYDDEPNKEKRYSMILDAMQKLSEQDPEQVYKELQPILDHNIRHFYNHNWNKELQQAWLTPNLLSE